MKGIKIFFHTHTYVQQATEEENCHCGFML